MFSHIVGVVQWWNGVVRRTHRSTIPKQHTICEWPPFPAVW